MIRCDMENTTSPETMKKPSEDSVQEMLDLIHRQQSVTNIANDGNGFRGRVFNPLPAIGAKANTAYGTLDELNEDDLSENKRKYDDVTTPPKLERESTVYNLRHSMQAGSKKNKHKTCNEYESPDVKSSAVEPSFLNFKATQPAAPRPFPLRREGTNYHLPPISQFPDQDPYDIERPSAPSPTSRKRFITQDKNWSEYDRPDSPLPFKDNLQFHSENIDTNSGRDAQLSPWQSTQEPVNDKGRWEEPEEVYERPKTARGGRRYSEQPQQTERPVTPLGRRSSMDTGAQRPKSARGRRRHVEPDNTTQDYPEQRPRTARGKHREQISEQEAYEPYERPRTARGRRTMDEETSDRPKTAKGRRRNDDNSTEKPRNGRGKPRPKSPGPRHPRYSVMSTNSNCSNGEFDEPCMLDNVAVLHSAT